MSGSGMESAGAVAATPPANLQVPPARRAVSRTAIVGAMCSSTRPLVVIAAGTGAGKTSLLAEWAAADPRPVAWVSLDAGHDDPGAFAQDIARALALTGLVDERLIHEVGEASTAVPSTVLSSLGPALLGQPQPFALVLDDIHHLRSTGAVSLLDGLADHVPGGSTLVLSGRTEPALAPVSRALGRTLEFAGADLALDDQATAAVFAAVGVAIDHVTARRVAERAEGWAAGIYLAALIARDDPSSLIGPAAVDGSHRYVADFLLRQTLDQIDPDLRTFLLATSALDELNGDLCDAVLERPGSQRLLRQLEQQNLFVVPLDGTRTWYRYHALFRDFLRGEARQDGADEATAIQLRAATWYLEHDRLDHAVEYLLGSRDIERLGPTLLAAIRPAYFEGRLATIERWLADAGDETIERLPPLACLAGWIAALSGQAAAAERWAATAAALQHEGPTADGWASFASSSAALRALLCAQGVASMRVDAQLAVDLEPAWSPWRATVVWLLGLACELDGEPAAAMARYEEAMTVDATTAGVPLLIAPVNAAFLAMDLGDWVSARAFIERAREAMIGRGPGRQVARCLAHAAEARLADHDGHVADRDRHAAVAMETRGVVTHAVPHGAVRLRSTLLGVLPDAEGSDAAALVREIDVVRSLRSDLGTLSPIEPTSAPRPQLLATPLTPAEQRVLPFLATHLSFEEIGTELFLSRNTVHSHATAIYRKLGASSRSEAVTKARDLGLS